MSCLIICGEKSGEEHAKVFVPELLVSCPDIKFWGVGGDWLKSVGTELLYHLNDFSSMGFSEVIGKIPYYFQAMKKIVSEVKKRNCKVAILVDFQDFNLKLAKRLAREGVKVLYYVAPQAWAWRDSRAQVLAASISDLFCLLPFEKSWFSVRGVKSIHYVGHPLARKYRKTSPKPIPTQESLQPIQLLVLAGSRNLEIKELLPIYKEAIEDLKQKFLIKVSTVVSSSVNKDLFTSLSHLLDTIYTDEQMEQALEQSHFVFCTSGTASLICAQKGVPSIVCYATSNLNEFIFNTFIKYKGFISLPNIIIDKELFPELKQEQVTAFNLTKLFKEIIESDERQNVMYQDIAKVQSILEQTDLNPSQIMAQRIREIYAQ